MRITFILGVLVILGASQGHAKDALINLPPFIEDMFHVTLEEPAAINTARGYFGRVPDPQDKITATNLWSDIRLFEEGQAPRCEDFSFLNWNDWFAQGRRDGEVDAFGIWNTPVHYTWRVGSSGLNGRIAVAHKDPEKPVDDTGMITPETHLLLQDLRGGYHEMLAGWLENNKKITLGTPIACDGFVLVDVEVTDG